MEHNWWKGTIGSTIENGMDAQHGLHNKYNIEPQQINTMTYKNTYI